MDSDARKAGVFLKPVNPDEREQKCQPERPGEITANAKHQMQATDTAQSFGEKHEAVLQVALAPAAVALGVFNHTLRRFFVAAFKVIGKPNFPVFAR